ncbi:hypothetical protein [Bradyrhizobium retamae]|nr:hypothetical protein [Bradyrhizobium retamae]
MDSICSHLRGKWPNFRLFVTRIGGEPPARIQINRKGDSMKGQVQSVFLAIVMAALLPISAPAAQVRECSAAVPSNQQGHWSWRLIDGRKCWYAGKTVISKSLLRWPAAAPAPAQAKAEAEPVSIVTEKRSEPMDAQARMLDDDNSFESRWRSRVTIE